MDLDALSRQCELQELSSCLIHRRDALIYRYEQIAGASSRLAPINSCTKSVLSALICIAMDQGKLPGPDTPAARFFPQLRDDPDERKQAMTLEHLLTLTAGFRWTEFGGANSFPAMTRSANWTAYTLEQPLADTPGTKMVYNSGVSQLLAAVLAQAVDETIAAYAERHLLHPLGIERYAWKRDPQGIHTGGFGMELAAADMLKFGLLFLHEGRTQGRQLISEALVNRATSPAISVSPPERGSYGWHWWCDEIAGLRYYYARGFGGQFIVIAPALDAVIVLTRQPRKRGPSPLDLFREHIAPMLGGIT